MEYLCYIPVSTGINHSFVYYIILTEAEITNLLTKYPNKYNQACYCDNVRMNFSIEDKCSVCLMISMTFSIHLLVKECAITKDNERLCHLIVDHQKDSYGVKFTFETPERSDLGQNRKKKSKIAIFNIRNNELGEYGYVVNLHKNKVYNKINKYSPDEILKLEEKDAKMFYGTQFIPKIR